MENITDPDAKRHTALWVLALLCAAAAVPVGVLVFVFADWRSVVLYLVGFGLLAASVRLADAAFPAERCVNSLPHPYSEFAKRMTGALDIYEDALANMGEASVAEYLRPHAHTIRRVVWRVVGTEEYVCRLNSAIAAATRADRPDLLERVVSRQQAVKDLMERQAARCESVAAVATSIAATLALTDPDLASVLAVSAGEDDDDQELVAVEQDVQARRLALDELDEQTGASLDVGGPGGCAHD